MLNADEYDVKLAEEVSELGGSVVSSRSWEKVISFPSSISQEAKNKIKEIAKSYKEMGFNMKLAETTIL